MICSTTEIQSQAARSFRGHALAEFNLCLALMFFAVFLPLLNLLLVVCSLWGLQLAVDNVAGKIACSESRSDALKLSARALDDISSSGFRLFHHLESVKDFSPDLNIVVRDEITQKISVLPADRAPAPLPQEGSHFRYAYRLTVPCRIYPLFNLSAVPIVGQIPLLGASFEARICSEKPVEYVAGLAP